MLSLGEPMNDERVKELEERLMVMGRLMTSMLLEFVTREAREALVAVETMRHALVMKGVISEAELAEAAERTFRHEESDMFPLEPEIPGDARRHPADPSSGGNRRLSVLRR
jgi:hypothetical protein